MTANTSVENTPIYFAVAPFAPELADQILRVFQQRLAKQPRLRIYALVDCLAVPGFAEFCAQQGWQTPVSTYAGQMGFDNAAAVAPSLLALPDDLAWLEQYMLRPLLAHCSGRPALGFITSLHTVDVVKAQLMRMARATDGDGSTWLLRFGDTRVWPPKAGLLTTEQHAHAFAGLDAWMVVDRYGAIQIVEGSPETPPASPDDLVKDFRMTARQFAQMIDWSEADAHLARLANRRDDAQFVRSPIEQYDVARQCLATLDRLGIDNEQERYRYIRFALRFPGNCGEHPAVQDALLAASRQQGTLSALLATIA